MRISPSCRSTSSLGIYTQCALFLMLGHKKPTLEEFDRRQKVGFDFLKSLESQI